MTTSVGNPREPRRPILEQADDLNIAQVLDQSGSPEGGLPDPELPREEVRMLYRTMVLLRQIDERGWKLQRSGRIAFWIPLRGQEAVQVGATHAMRPQDWIFRAHREMAPWLMRGASLTGLFAQFFGAADEPQKGRRLPCLMGSRSVQPGSGSHPGGFLYSPRLWRRLGRAAAGPGHARARAVR